jgi:hypothetical protein
LGPRRRWTRGRWISILVPLLFVALPGAGLLARERPFEEFLAGMEFVAEGTLLGYEEYRETVRGGWPATRYHVAMKMVLAGAAEDSVLVVSSGGTPRNNRSRLVPGTKVLVWGVRSSDDGWRLWGGVAGIGVDDELFPVTTSRDALAMAGDDPTSYIRFRETWAAMRTRAGTNVFEGSRGVALVRLDTTPDGCNIFDCTFLGWIVEADCPPPLRVEFDPGPDCVREITLGDSVIVPVDCAGTSLVRACPRALRVDHGFLPGLGVPLSKAHRVLVADSNRVVVRPIASPER